MANVVVDKKCVVTVMISGPRNRKVCEVLKTMGASASIVRTKRAGLSLKSVALPLMLLFATFRIAEASGEIDDLKQTIGNLTQELKGIHRSEAEAKAIENVARDSDTRELSPGNGSRPLLETADLSSAQGDGSLIIKRSAESVLTELLSKYNDLDKAQEDKREADAAAARLAKQGGLQPWMKDAALMTAAGTSAAAYGAIKHQIVVAEQHDIRVTGLNKLNEAIKARFLPPRTVVPEADDSLVPEADAVDVVVQDEFIDTNELTGTMFYNTEDGPVGIQKNLLDGDKDVFLSAVRGEEDGFMGIDWRNQMVSLIFIGLALTAWGLYFCFCIKLKNKGHACCRYTDEYLTKDTQKTDIEE